MIELTSEQNAWIRKHLIQQVSDLFDANIERAIELLADTDDKKFNLPFVARMDFSGTTPKITTKIRCSKSWPDERVEEMYDPNQPALPFPGEENGAGESEEEPFHPPKEEPAEDKPKKKARKRKAKGAKA